MTSSSACKNLNQMATRVFMLLLVTRVGFLFFNMKTFQHGVVDWRSWTTLDVLKTDSVQEWGCSQLSSISRGLLLSMQRATGYLHCHKLHNFSFWLQGLSSVSSQPHGHLVGPESSSILTMEPLTKLTSHSRTLITIVCIWWNSHDTHPTRLA